MSDSSKTPATWAPRCPMCSKRSKVVREDVTPHGNMQSIRRTLTCDGWHSWTASYITDNPWWKSEASDGA